MKLHECVQSPKKIGSEVVLWKPPLLEWTGDRHLVPHSRHELLRFHPEITLLAPQIPPNTGTIARLCAAFSCRLNLVETLGFTITEKALNRESLDYWSFVDVTLFSTWEELLQNRPDRRFIFVETGSQSLVHQFHFSPGDILVFGSETVGISESVMASMLLPGGRHAHVSLPMYNTGVRSINLSNVVSMVAHSAVTYLHDNVNF